MGRTGSVVAVGMALLLGACGTDTPAPAVPTTSASVAGATPGDDPAPTSAATPGADPLAADVRDAGSPLAPDAGVDAGSLLAAAPGGVQLAPAPDGSSTATVTGPSGIVAWVAPPAGGAVEVEADGSLAVHDAAGTVVAALGVPAAPDGTRGGWRVVGDVALLDAPGGSATFAIGTAALVSATWGEAEGGRSLAVVPAEWVRGGSLAAQRAVSSQLQAVEPEAASASMQAQLWCHVLGAPDKASWNLEPWRPDVGTATMLTTRCNPTDADLGGAGL